MRQTVQLLRETVLTPLFALTLVCSVQAGLFWPLFRGMEPYGDDLSIHFAEIAQMVRAIQAGDFDFWNAGANSGYAMAYYYQYLPMIVPAVVYLLLGGLVPLLLIFKLFIALPMILLPVATYRALIAVGLRPAAAVGAGVATAFVFEVTGWGHGLGAPFGKGLYTQPWAMLFYPLAVAYAYRFLSRGENLGRAVGYALLTGLCHPFIGFSLAPALLLTPWWKTPLPTVLKRGSLLVGLVLLTSAHLWLPILIHYDGFGGFPSRLTSEVGLPVNDFANKLFAGHLLDMGRIIRGFGTTNIGFPVLTYLSLAGVVYAIWRRGVLLVLVSQSLLFALLVMAGPYSGKTPDDLIPGIRFIAPMQFTLAAIAGAVFVEGLTAGWQFTESLATRSPRNARVVLNTGILLLFLIGGGMVWVVFSNATYLWPRHVRTVDMIGFLARNELQPVSDAMAARGPGRMIGDAWLGTANHWWMYLPWAYGGPPAVRAYGASALQASPNYIYLRNHFDLAEQAALWNVRYLILQRNNRAKIAERVPEATVFFEQETHAIAEMPGPFQFMAPITLAGTLPANDRLAARSQIIDWLESKAFQRGEHLLIGEALPDALPAQGRVLEEQEGSSWYRARVAVNNKATTFLLKVSYHPAWRATIDGAPALIHRVSPQMMAVSVPGGEHEIRFSFHRPWWTWALIVLALVALGLVGGWSWRQARRSTSTDDD